jgi:hypothetical protein
MQCMAIKWQCVIIETLVINKLINDVTVRIVYATIAVQVLTGAKVPLQSVTTVRSSLLTGHSAHPGIPAASCMSFVHTGSS